MGERDRAATSRFFGFRRAPDLKDLLNFIRPVLHYAGEKDARFDRVGVSGGVDIRIPVDFSVWE